MTASGHDDQQRPTRSSSAFGADLQRALNLYHARRYAEAEKACHEILRVQPRHFDGTRLLATLRCEQADYGEAVRLLDLSLAINPNSALAYHERGNALRRMNRPAEALASFDKAILLKPDYVPAMISRAHVLKQLGPLEEALACYEKVVALEPTNAEAFNNRGVVFVELKQLENALASFDGAIALKSDYATAYNNKGNVLRELKRLDEALESFDRAIALKTDYTDAYNNRSLALLELGRLEEALASSDKAIAIQSGLWDLDSLGGLEPAELIRRYDKVISLEPGNAEAFNNRGNALQSLRRFDEALASYDRALALKPEHAVALNNRGNVLQELKRFDEALVSFDKAIAIDPSFAEVFNNRGNTLTGMKRFDEALVSIDKAIALRPDYAHAFNSRGNVLKELRQFDAARASYDRAIDLQPDYAGAFNNRGNALRDLNRLDEALASYDKAIDLKPDYAGALLGRALCRLLLGRFAEGWPGYERRFEANDLSSTIPNFGVAAWQGEELAGRRILVFTEQGLGDAIQFVRYLPSLLERQAEVTVLTKGRLLRLLRSLAPTVRITDAISGQEVFDFQCPLLSLPYRLGTDLSSIPSKVPYLKAEADLVKRWKERIGRAGFKVGIAWQGNPEAKVERGRSVPLREFAPLLAVPGVRVISLQRHHGLDQLADLKSNLRIEELGDEFDSGPDAFVDTAAVMENLDLIITSDTAIAHLAGALGRPAWVALKHVPEWRWMLDRRDSPWYPTMRLFRQPENGDWRSVFVEIERELKSLVAAQTAGAASDQRTNPRVLVSWGELIDKITILEIKSTRLASADAISNVRKELTELLQAVPPDFANSETFVSTKADLRSVNEALWEIEDQIRLKEAAGKFDGEFVALARSVYFKNDERAKLKRQINALMSSQIVEEKQYAAYDKENQGSIDLKLLFENGNLRLKQCKHGAMMFLANDRFIGRSLDLYGEFSEGEIDIFKQVVFPGMSVVDAGANIGAHTIVFSKVVGSAGSVLAFEPQRILHQILCGNVALNACTNVTAVHAGLGAAPGSVAIPTIDYAQGGNFGGVALDRAGDESVPLHTLDSYHLKRCDFLKIDVEGMELQVLKGAKSVITQRAPILYVENDRADKSEELIGWLMANGYRLYWHLPPLFNSKNYFALKENVFEKTVSVNMLCIPKSKPITVKGQREITSPTQNWRSALLEPAKFRSAPIDI